MQPLQQAKDTLNLEDHNLNANIPKHVQMKNSITLYKESKRYVSTTLHWYMLYTLQYQGGVDVRAALNSGVGSAEGGSTPAHDQHLVKVF